MTNQTGQTNHETLLSHVQAAAYEGGCDGAKDARSRELLTWTFIGIFNLLYLVLLTILVYSFLSTLCSKVDMLIASCGQMQKTISQQQTVNVERPSTPEELHNERIKELNKKRLEQKELCDDRLQ